MFVCIPSPPSFSRLSIFGLCMQWLLNKCKIGLRIYFGVRRDSFAHFFVFMRAIVIITWRADPPPLTPGPFKAVRYFYEGALAKTNFYWGMCLLLSECVCACQIHSGVDVWWEESLWWQWEFVTLTKLYCPLVPKVHSPHVWARRAQR